MTESHPRILTGDQPTGRLHLGHFVGSLENRVAMQRTHDCYFIIANLHALNSRADDTAGLRDDVIQITIDYLSVGIDPNQSVIFLQSEVPAIAEMTWYFASLLGCGRLMRNPTVKDEIRIKNLGDNYPFAFLMYPVGQIADILAFRPDNVPVGEDQLPHIEMTREIARRFNITFCGVDPQAGDDAHCRDGLFPIPDASVGRVARLVGIDGKHKMSKSLNNAIFLSDTPKQVRKKCGKIYTGRQAADSPGVVEGNALWELHDAFNPDQSELADLKHRYREGTIGDGDCKQRLAEHIDVLLDPIRQRRAQLESKPDEVFEILRDGTTRANKLAEQTLAMAKDAMKMDFFSRRVEFAPM